jgi:rubrerythrin
MKYDEWIERERRIRANILNSSPLILRERIYRVCKNCGEICLCHEEKCPNCGSDEIINEVLEKNINIINQIRCKHRFINIFNPEK